MLMYLEYGIVTAANFELSWEKTILVFPSL